MRRRTSRSLTAVVAVGLVVGLASCGDDDPADDTPAVTGSPATAPTSPTADDDGTDTGGTASAADGRHTVATVAGDVEVELGDGRLVLAGVRPASAWQHTVDEESEDEIEVDFRGDGRELRVSLDVDDDDRDLDVSLDYTEGRPAGVETVTIGSVGEVDYRVSGGSLRVGEVRPGEGWTNTEDDGDDDEIEIDFRHEDGTVVDVSIDVDD